MRPLASLIEKTVKFREPPVPDGRLTRVNPPPVLRLDEGVLDLFQHACLINDLDAAADLTGLMEKWQARRRYDTEEQKRMAGVHVLRMRGELQRRHIMQGSRPPATR